LSPGIELCARLGLVLLPSPQMGGKIIHAVLVDSPAARARLRSLDIVFAVNGTPLKSIRFATFSDHRRSRLVLKIFVAELFELAEVVVRIEPEPYRPLEDILAEAQAVVRDRPIPLEVSYRNPRFVGARRRSGVRA
jgi:hypothetical protein